MKQYKIKLYSFAELGEEAQQAIIDREKENPYGFHYFLNEEDANDRIATLDAFCDAFNIRYNFLNSYGRAISWHFTDDTNREAAGKYLLRFINNHFDTIFERKRYYKNSYKNGGKEYELKKRDSKILWKFGGCQLTGVYCDCDILVPFVNWLASPKWSYTIEDLVQECFDNFFSCWEKGDEYNSSDEAIRDMIESNWEDCEFYENGDKFEGCPELLETVEQ